MESKSSFDALFKSSISKEPPVRKGFFFPIDAKLQKFQYLGSKQHSLEWLETQILEQTNLLTLEGVRIADLFSGSGCISQYFRSKNSIVYSNDIERFSFVLTHAQTLSNYSEKVKEKIEEYNEELSKKKHKNTIGKITEQYSPYNGNEKLIFTLDNAKRIDYLRERIYEEKESFSQNDFFFLVASLVQAATKVSNIISVYTCFFKQFKPEALAPLILEPIHTEERIYAKDSKVYNEDSLSQSFLGRIDSDIVYIDAPSDERQYSKLYEPLNDIVSSPYERSSFSYGVDSKFLSSFCAKETAISSFELLLENLHTKWIFISYSGKGILSHETLLECFSKYGNVKVIEKSHKQVLRKKEEIVPETVVQEYLYCIEKVEEGIVFYK